MFILVAYLAIVWFAVWKYRRRWQAGVVLLLAPVPVLVTMGLLGVFGGPLDDATVRTSGIMHSLFGIGSVLNLVFVSYIGILWLVGGIIAVAKPSTSRVPCNRCGYDLVGTQELSCPECGGRLSVCVQELRMQAYMADRERVEESGPTGPDKPSHPHRPTRLPAHLTRTSTAERAETRA